MPAPACSKIDTLRLDFFFFFFLGPLCHMLHVSSRGCGSALCKRLSSFTPPLWCTLYCTSLEVLLYGWPQSYIPGVKLAGREMAVTVGLRGVTTRAVRGRVRTELPRNQITVFQCIVTGRPPVYVSSI